MALTGRFIGAALLCALLALMSVASPLCPACDGLAHPPLTHAQVNQSAPSPDDCNGVCACCGFHWLPAAPQPFHVVQAAPSLSIKTPISSTFPDIPPPYLPPRA